MSRTQRRVILPEETRSRAADAAHRTRRLRALGKLLDNSIVVPGTGWRIGLDPIIGLLPGVGDLVGAAVSGYIILEGARSNMPPVMLARMLMNVGIDTLVGAVPAVGDLFDAAWKANTKNVALLERHLSVAEPAGEKRSVAGITLLALLVLLAILGAGLALTIFIGRLLWNVKIG